MNLNRKIGWGNLINHQDQQYRVCISAEKSSDAPDIYASVGGEQTQRANMMNGRSRDAKPTLIYLITAAPRDKIRRVRAEKKVLWVTLASSTFISPL